MPAPAQPKRMLHIGSRVDKLAPRRPLRADARRQSGIGRESVGAWAIWERAYAEPVSWRSEVEPLTSLRSCGDVARA